MENQLKLNKRSLMKHITAQPENHHDGTEYVHPAMIC